MSNNKLNFKPVNNYILVIVPEVSEKSAKGIIKSPGMIAKEKKELDDFMEVAAYSDSIKFELNIGDKVLLNNKHIPVIPIEGSDYGITDANNVAGIVKSIK